LYSCENRMRAVMLFIKYDHSISAVINGLGYPSHQMLLRWYSEYAETDTLHAAYKKKSKNTEAHKQEALDQYWIDQPSVQPLPLRSVTQGKFCGITAPKFKDFLGLGRFSGLDSLHFECFIQKNHTLPITGSKS